MTKLENIALARIAALENLLVCYRIGKQPSQRLFKELERTKTRLAELTEEFYPGSVVKE